MLRYMAERARPGLVALYNIRPGNRADLFLQPRSLGLTIHKSGPNNLQHNEQEAQLMLTTGSTHLAVSQGQQTWYHSTCYI